MNLPGDRHWPDGPSLPFNLAPARVTSAVRASPVLTWAAPLAVVALLLPLYAASACRSVYWYDSAEFATAAKVWGVPHPPGYPAYVLIAHLFTYLPLSPAHAVNLLSAISMACAMGLLTVLCQQLGVRSLYSAMSALLVGVSDLIWSNATVAEVYGPGLLFAVGILLLLLRALRHKTVRPVWLACWLVGFGLGVHYFLVSLGLGYVLLLYKITRTQRTMPSDYVVAAAMFAFGLTVFVLLPLRAAQGTPLNFGDPQTWEQFVWVIAGGTYGQFFQLITWDRLFWYGSLVWATWTPPGVLLCALGIITALRQKQRFEWAALALCVCGNLGCFLPYWVHDPEVFLIPSLVLVAPWVGLGAEWLHRNLTEFMVGKVSLAHLVPGLVSAVITHRAVSAYPSRDLSSFRAADDYAQTLVEQLPEGAFIANFTTPPEWQFDAVFTYYRLVMNARPDITMLTLPTPELLVQLVNAGLRVYVYTPTYDVVRPPFLLLQDRELIRLGLDGSQGAAEAWFDWSGAPAPSASAPASTAEPPAVDATAVVPVTSDAASDSALAPEHDG